MTQVDIKNLSGMFLIAVPALKDPNFERTVVLICDHTRDGAFGLVINRILLSSFVPLRKGLNIQDSLIDLPVYYGGPVKPEQGYILYTPPDTYYPSIKIDDTLALTTSREILVDISTGKGPEKYLFTLGFAGWAPGQLEYELVIDSWLIAPLEKTILFDTPVDDRWKAAAGSIGVDLSRMFFRQGQV